MELLLKIINTPDENIASKSFRFDESGGTIGRSTSSSWVLNCSKKIISNTHAKIKYKASAYYLIDTSGNGVFYNQRNKRLAKNEMVELKDSDKLYIGAYQILVSIIRSSSSDVDEFSVSRFLDLSKDVSNADDFLIEDEEKKEYISQSSMLFEDDLFGKDPFGDEENSTVADKILVKDIIPPTAVEKKIELDYEPKEELSIKSNQGEAETLLLSLFSSKLGIDIESMDKKEQIRVINELADSLLIAIEGIDSLKSNINRINKRLEINSQKSHKKSKNISNMLSNDSDKKQLSQYLRDSFSEVKNHHTALYESIKNIDLFLARKFSPNSLISEFEELGRLNSWSPKQKDAQIWKEYSKKYSYLNDDKDTKDSLVKNFIIKRYRDVMDMFSLAK